MKESAHASRQEDYMDDSGPEENFDNVKKSPIISEVLENTDGTPESIKRHFETIGFEGFADLLTKTNGYYRHISEHVMDGTGKLADGYMPPDPEDRKTLLQEAYDKAMRQESIKKTAFCLGISILTIHPFLDANGRTSRTTFELLTNGYSGSIDDDRLFSFIGDRDESAEDEYHRSGTRAINLDPGNIVVGEHYRDTLAWDIESSMMVGAIERRFGNDLSNVPKYAGRGSLSHEHNENSELTSAEQIELGNIFGSRALAYVACTDSFSDDLYRKSLRLVDGTFLYGKGADDYFVISYDQVVENMSYEDLEKLRSAFRQVRTDYVRSIINVVERNDFDDIYNQVIARLNGWKSENLY